MSLNVTTAWLERAKGTSSASFQLTDSAGKRNPVTAADVAGDLRLWAQTMQFPGVRSVRLVRPADVQREPYVNDTTLDIVVADPAAGGRLQARFPETSGHWEVARPPR